MIYLMSVTLVTCTVVVCVMIRLRERVYILEKELIDSHVTLAKVTNELDKKVTDQLGAIAERAEKAILTSSSSQARIEELGNKLAGLGMVKR